MGADFLCTGLAIEQDKEPRFDITPTDEQVKQYRVEYGNDYGDEEATDEEIKTKLTEAVEMVAAGWNDQRRDCAHLWFNFFKIKVLVAGGDSWGDSPSDLYDAICQLEAAGMIGEMGFK